jgi:hypothetical protein
MFQLDLAAFIDGTDADGNDERGVDTAGVGWRRVAIPGRPPARPASGSVRWQWRSWPNARTVRAILPARMFGHRFASLHLFNRCLRSSAWFANPCTKSTSLMSHVNAEPFHTSANMLSCLEHVFHAEPLHTSAKHALLSGSMFFTLNRCTLQLNMLYL